MEVFKALTEAVVSGQATKVRELTEEALGENIAPGEIISEGLIPGMDIVGERFKNGELFVPEMLIAAKAMQDSLNFLKPLLTQGEVRSAGKVIIGTVKGDLHDIGKNLVVMMMEGAGFEVIDLGVSVSVERFVQETQKHAPHIVAMSALLTTTMPVMRQTIEALEQAGMRKQVKVMVGGAPLNSAFAAQIGADGYAADAPVAVDLARSMVA